MRRQYGNNRVRSIYDPSIKNPFSKSNSIIRTVINPKLNQDKIDKTSIQPTKEELEIFNVHLTKNIGHNTVIGEFRIKNEIDPSSFWIYSFSQGKGSDHNSLFKISADKIQTKISQYILPKYNIRITATKNDGTILEAHFVIQTSNN